jgi:phage anti-repressor protein
MNYSIEQMHDFLESMAKGSTWAEAIQKVLKMDEQTYYGQIAQYLADEL